MPETKRYWKTKGTPVRVDFGSTGDVREIQTRIACKEKSAPMVLSEVSSALTSAAAQQRDPLIILEDLGVLGDSVASLVKGLSRLLVGYPRTVTFWESSGYTEAFLSVMEKPAR